MIENSIAIIHGDLYTPSELIPGGTLLIDGERITALLPAGETPPPGRIVIDAAGAIATPGLIDIHIHGAAGYDTMDASPAALDNISRFLASHGVTAFLPTTMSAPAEAILAALQAVSSCQAGKPAGARLLGAHLEGPYLNPRFAGAQPLRHIRLPHPEEYRAFFAAGPVRMLTLAPELEGALELIKFAAARGASVAAGHSGASLETALASVPLGLNGASHLFNGMAPLHHRQPGVAGAALLSPEIYCQVIADGVHVHPAMLDLIARLKGASRLVLISDAMRAAGLADGRYTLGEQQVDVRQGIARLAGQDNLAGSTLTLERALAVMQAASSLPLTALLPMATSAPAAAVGLAGNYGTLRAGAAADIAVFSPDLQPLLTIVGGHILYHNDALPLKGA